MNSIVVRVGHGRLFSHDLEPSLLAIVELPRCVPGSEEYMEQRAFMTLIEDVPCAIRYTGPDDMPEMQFYASFVTLGIVSDAGYRVEHKAAA